MISAQRQAQLESACRQLVASYPTQNWWPAQGRFEVMAGAVLVQNGRWANAAVAIRALRAAKALKPDRVARLGEHQLATLIRPAGCQSVKARRLVALARWVNANGGLRRIARFNTADLRHALLTVHGVGPETADAILCFAFGRRAFVADTYARRWLSRMGLARGRGSDAYQLCRELVEEGLGWPPAAFQDLHAAVVLHGQQVCRPQPVCAVCPVKNYCASRLCPVTPRLSGPRK
jgi:endonuclease-3 related protein